MDHKEFGEKAPSLRVTLSSKWAMGKSTSLACAPLFIEKGRYSFSGRFKFEEGIDKSTSIFIHMIPEGEKRARVLFPLGTTGSFKVETYHSQNFMTGLKGQIKPWRKSGWQEFEFVFTVNKPCIFAPQFNFKLKNRSAQAHAHVDDFKLERKDK
jgi:hypothetical protein